LPLSPLLPSVVKLPNRYDFAIAQRGGHSITNNQ
jgi:hypothetical protein